MTDNRDDFSGEPDHDLKTQRSTADAHNKKSAEVFGHPAGLFFLFFAELWERFSFYGMRALLTLYLARELFVDLSNGKEVAYEIYAAYGSLVYFTPAIGGMLADRVIGHKNSIMLGALLMTIGHFTMAFENLSIFYLSLGLLIVGNGFFKPNISSLVGGLYPEGDVRRDGGFTIFYLGINLGAFLAPLVCGYLGESYGWHYGFSAAGIGMGIGLLVFWYGRWIGIYGEQGEQPVDQASRNVAGINVRFWVYGLSFLSAPLFAFLVRQSEYKVLFNTGVLQFLLISLLTIVVIYLVKVCMQSDRVTRDRLIVIGVLTFFVTVFWAFFEQAGSSLTLFAEEQVRLVGLNASQTNAVNPFYIVILAIPFSMMWIRL
jgi:POT family proton-dependent oligopeptide transporter